MEELHRLISWLYRGVPTRRRSDGVPRKPNEAEIPPFRIIIECADLDVGHYLQREFLKALIQRDYMRVARADPRNMIQKRDLNGLEVLGIPVVLTSKM